MKGKKILAVFLSFAVALSFVLVPAGPARTAVAGGDDTYISTAADLKAELENGGNGVKILSNDIHCGTDIVVGNCVLTIDLNGHNLTMDGCFDMTGNCSPGLKIYNHGSGGGSVVANGEYLFKLGKKTASEDSNLTLEGCKYYSSGQGGAIIYYECNTFGIPENEFSNNGLYISNSKFTAYGNDQVIEVAGSDASHVGCIEINNATMSSENAPCITSGTYCRTLINGGSYVTTGADYALYLLDPIRSELQVMLPNAYADGTAYNEWDDDNSIRPLYYETLGKHSVFQCGSDSMFGNPSCSVNDEEMGYATIVNGTSAYVGGMTIYKATPYEGYKFKEWQNSLSVTVSEDATYCTTMPDGDLVLRAIFEEMPSIGTLKSYAKCPASAVYTGKAIKPTATINGVEKDTDYVVSYSNNTKVGKASIKFTGIGNYTSSFVKYFKINPKKASISSLASGSRSLKVKMGTKVSSTGGTTYKIYYRVKGASSWKTTTTTSQTKTIKNLKKGKTYQVKVCAYSKVSGEYYYGACSAIKTSKKIK